jgi:SAM-dependent methyltransferase
MSDEGNIKDRVKERYGAIADQYLKPETAAPIEILESRPLSAASCCGPSGCGPAPASGQLYQVADGVSCCSPGGEAASTTLAEALYSQTAIADLPDSVTSISLGCGNPTAIANLKPGEVVLDLGSGGGIDCFLAAKAVGPTGYVIGVDMTDSMLNLANQNKAKIGLTNVEFRKGEIENLPVENNSVDVIISNCVINLSPDKDAVFREAFRVLKPGARFTVSDMVTEGDFPAQLRANINAWAGCITGALDQEVYLNKLRAAGFANVAVESRVSYGLEHLDLLDEASRDTLTKDVDWSTVPANVRLYSAHVVAYKPA